VAPKSRSTRHNEEGEDCACLDGRQERTETVGYSEVVEVLLSVRLRHLRYDEVSRLQQRKDLSRTFRYIHEERLPAIPHNPVTCGFACVMPTMDAFEGTEQIQQLVISRAISGLRIE
jgi:hypothetical protein